MWKHSHKDTSLRCCSKQWKCCSMLFVSICCKGRYETHLSESPGNWRVNAFSVVSVVNCITRRSGVCFKISSGDTKPSPEQCLRSLCSYNWQFTLQTLHLQHCGLIIFVGIVIVWVTVQCMNLWLDTEWSRGKTSPWTYHIFNCFGYPSRKCGLPEKYIKKF